MFPRSPSCAVERRKVLLVDCSPTVNELLAELSGHHEWNIHLAKNNREAMSLSSLHDFDLIITGERTSGQADLKLLSELRLIRSHVRLIILTDEFTPGDVLNAIRARAFSYFARPICLEGLADIIQLAMTMPPWDDGIEVLSATPNWVRLAVRCDLGSAHRLVHFYREASDLPKVETEEVIVAFHEILLNAMEYGGKFDRTQYLEVSYVRARRMVICKVKDPGTGFSLEELTHSALANPADEPLRHATERESKGMRPGGYGILMARRFLDELIYSESGNEVLLVKYLAEPQDHAA